MLTIRIILALATISFALPVSAIQNSDGVPVQYMKSVYAVAANGGLGSGTAFMYPRCILTARHVVEGNHESNIEIIHGPDANNPIAPSQWGSRISIRPRFFGGADRYTDLAVLWATGFQNDATSQHHYIAHGYAGWTPITTIATSTTNVSGYFYGYGITESTGGGFLLYGDTWVNKYIMGATPSPQQPGAYYETKNKQAANTQSCTGDSGGPFAPSGQLGAGIAGVISETYGNCGSATKTRATALTADTIAGHRSNRDWVLDKVEITCGKEVQFGITGGQGGSIIGSISPAQKRLVAEDHNGTNGWISCNNGIDDCREMVHFGQTVTVFAQPAANHEFVRWKSDGGACDCEEFSATCTLSFQNIGSYGPMYSRDVSDCEAEFQPVGGY